MAAIKIEAGIKYSRNTPMLVAWCSFVRHDDIADQSGNDSGHSNDNTEPAGFFRPGQLASSDFEQHVADAKQRHDR